jgi:hypothetical protein
MTAALTGVLLALAVGLLGTLGRFERDRGRVPGVATSDGRLRASA